MRIAAMTIAAGIAVSAMAGTAGAADNGSQADPIDKALNACLAKPENETTRGMLDCTDAAYKAYDAELNAVYAEVMGKLDPRSKVLLRESQRRWVAFREAERDAMNGPWTRDRGSIVSLDIAAAAIDAVKERVRELRLYE